MGIINIPLPPPNAAKHGKCNELEQMGYADGGLFYIERHNSEESKCDVHRKHGQIQHPQYDDDVALNDWKQMYDEMKRLNDELVAKVGNLAAENSQLFAMCQLLEEASIASPAQDATNLTRIVPPHRSQYTEASFATIEDMQAENAALHRSLEDAMDLASNMNGIMSHFARSLKDTEETLTSMEKDLNRAELSKEETAMAFDALKKENRVLHKVLQIELKRHDDTGDACHGHAVLTENDIENERLRRERDEAYGTCRVLQEEINLLRRTMKDAQLRDDNVVESAVESSTALYHEASILGSTLSFHDTNE